MTIPDLISQVSTFLAEGKFDDAIREIEAAQAAEQPAPVHEIIALYHKRLPMLGKVETLPPARRATINARWASKKDFRSLEFWDKYFARVSRSLFLTGQKVDWKASFDWLLGPKNFQKVLDGNYDPPRTGGMTASDEAAYALSGPT